MTTRLLALFSFALLLSAPLAAQGTKTAPENASIRREDMKVDLQFLASESTRGRLTGSPEDRIAAEYIKARFQKIGLAPAGSGGTYYQPFTMVATTLGDGNQVAVSVGDNFTMIGKVGQDFYPQKFSGSGRAKGRVVFAGFGIGPDDYRGDVNGAIVLVLDHEPGEFDPNSQYEGLITSDASNPIRKILLAQSKGAAGVLFVEDVHNHPGRRDMEAAAKATWPARAPQNDRLTLADWVDQVRIPAAQVSPMMVEAMLRGTSRSLLDLSRGAETAAPPLALPGVQVELATAVDRHAVYGYNVVGMLEGADPKLKDECVILSAHHDHLGLDESGAVLPGADDNISGVVAVIEAAEAYAAAAKNGIRPPRSVLFVSFDAEEKQLLGSWAYVEHPALPLQKTVAVLNMDLIGRSEEVVADPKDWRWRGLAPTTADQNRNTLNVLGETRHPWMKEEVDKANAAFGLQLKRVLDNNASQLLRRSDQWPFLQRGVPAVWMLTGLHRDYHTMWDREERIEYDKLERVARMVHQLSWNLAQQGRGK